MAQQPFEIEPSGSLSLFEGGFTLHASRFPFKLESNPQFQKFCFALLRDRSARKLASFSQAPHFMKTLRLK